MNRPRIMLLEDNPDDVELMQIALREVQFDGELVVQDSGQDALDFLLGEGTGAGSPLRQGSWLFILDLKLQGLQGTDVLHCLKSDPRTCAIPIVVLSTSEVPSDVRQVYELGANAYLRKPVTLAAFIGLVEGLVGFWFSTELLRAEGR